MAYLFGKFVWFEHVSGDVQAARGFYGELFGWKSEGLPMGGQTYHMIQNGADGIGGFRSAMPGVAGHWMGYLSVPDVDEYAGRATAAGGRILMPPADFPPVGRGAALADPGGGAFSIWKGAEGDRADAPQVSVGDWYWNELMTRDPDAALRFYEGVFGYDHDSMDMGPQGTYYVLTKDGVPRGGLMRVPEPDMPSAWMPYVRVADCDASAARAGTLGARICVEPKDIPQVGRFAVLIDPAGAALGIIRGDR